MVKTNGVLISGIAAVALLVTPVIANRHEDRFTDWSDPVTIGPVVNSEFGDFGVTISRDGLSLYFQSARPGGSGGAASTPPGCASGARRPLASSISPTVDR